MEVMLPSLTLETLPEELVASILSFLDCDSLAKTAEVCRRLYYLCNDEQLWQKHCKAGECLFPTFRLLLQQQRGRYGSRDYRVR